jgi:hypothetical protein
VCSGRRKPRAAPKQAARSSPWCCWRCRCTLIQASTTAGGADLSVSSAATPGGALGRAGDHAPQLPQARPHPGVAFVLEQQVLWLSFEELGQEPNLDPLLNLLTLPVRHESVLQACSQQMLAKRPDLNTVVPTWLPGWEPTAEAGFCTACTESFTPRLPCSLGRDSRPSRASNSATKRCSNCWTYERHSRSARSKSVAGTGPTTNPRA